MLIALVDNSPLGPYRYAVQRFRRVLRQVTGARVEALSFGQLRADGASKVIGEAEAVVLGGFGGWIPIRHYPIAYAQEFELIRECGKPMLGICGGHQLIALCLGGMVEHLGRLVAGFQSVHRISSDPLFNSLGGEFVVFESHRDHVSRLPDGFELLASSRNTRVEAIRSRKRMVYGVQFHPERFDRSHPDGRRLLENFFRVARTG